MNPNHAPAGSPNGGQFVSVAVGGKAVQIPPEGPRGDIVRARDSEFTTSNPEVHEERGVIRHHRDHINAIAKANGVTKSVAMRAKARQLLGEGRAYESRVLERAAGRRETKGKNVHGLEFSAALPLARAKALALALATPARLTLSAAGDVLYLSASAEPRDALTLGSGLPQTHNELPIHYRWMDAAVAGKWTHPRTGQAVPIDGTRIDKWVSGIKLARTRGVDLPACKDHKETADAALGAIYDAERRGDRLALLVGFYGDDSLTTAQRNKLSIGIDPDFKDSFGNKYGEAIRHVAITPVPVIHGQNGFHAASSN